MHRLSVVISAIELLVDRSMFFCFCSRMRAVQHSQDHTHTFKDEKTQLTFFYTFLIFDKRMSILFIRVT